ncbi:MAG: AbrB/MazE/SpoVT family DNA-binding domain-containing protein [Thermoanaerobaculales bacterium]|nr:AbrB/MazE/SpoVT family DNA-binding domain-containing protein [Thermoanaerobaculales bacterium]
MARLVEIGNSRGIRIPKPFIEGAELEDCELELKIVPEGLLVTPTSKGRRGWKAAFEDMYEHGDDTMVMAAEPSTAFDHEDWEW